MNLADIEDADQFTWEDMFVRFGPPEPSTRLVLFVMRKNLNKKKGWTVWHGQVSIAEQTGLKERAVRTHIANAERAGWLTVRKRYNGTSIYTATIPDGLVEFVKSKPWKDDPTWRPANIAARSKRERPANIATRKHVTLTRETQRRADIAKAPANPAKAPANNDKATGKSCQSDRQIQPPNSLSNQLFNQLENQLPMGQVAKSDCDRGGVPTAPAAYVNDPKTPLEQRLESAAETIRDKPTWLDKYVASRHRLTLEQVAQLRAELSPRDDVQQLRNQ